MVTVQESKTKAREDAFIKDDMIRVDGRIITTIEEVRNSDYSNHVFIDVSEPESIAEWKYDEAALKTWDEDSCWLVKLAKERGYELENLDGLEGEEVCIRYDGEEESWYMDSKHPRDIFDESEIQESISVDEKETLSSTDNLTDNNDVEMDCMRYETIGEYFKCQIEEMNEIHRNGACNIIECVVDTPYDQAKWEFRKPYDWSEDNPLVQLAESRNYGNANFTELVGDDILVKRIEDEWQMTTEPPDEYDEKNVEEKSKPSLWSPEYQLAFLLITLSFFGYVMLLI